MGLRPQGMSLTRPAPYSMSTLKRLQNGDLLLIFNLIKEGDRVEGGFPRHRLCTVVSSDEGQTWSHLRKP